MTTTEAELYWEGLGPRERFLFDLLHTGVAAALGGDEKRATSIIEKAWKSADRLHPTGAQEALQQVANDQLKRFSQGHLDAWAGDWTLGQLLACRHCGMKQTFTSPNKPFPAHEPGCEGKYAGKYPLLDLGEILRSLPPSPDPH